MRKTATAKGATPGGGPLHLGEILVGLDFSEPSGKALLQARKMAGVFGARLNLVHVVPILLGGQFLPATVLLDSARRQLDREAAVLEEAGVRARVWVRSGDAFTQIVKCAGEIGADLIVVATHGRSGWKHVLLGSTAERVVRHAGCPVMVVRESR